MTFEEICEKCETDPQYSFAIKLQRYMIRSSTDLRHIKMHKREFVDSLTDEEIPYFEKTQKMGLKGMIRKEVKRQSKNARYTLPFRVRNPIHSTINKGSVPFSTIIFVIMIRRVAARAKNSDFTILVEVLRYSKTFLRIS